MHAHPTSENILFQVKSVAWRVCRQGLACEVHGHRRRCREQNTAHRLEAYFLSTFIAKTSSFMSAFLASTLHVSLIQRWGHGERLQRGFLLPVSRRCMGALALVLADARVPYCVAPLCLLPAESHGTDVSPMNRVALGSGHLLSRSVGTTACPPVLELLGRHLVLSHGHHMGWTCPLLAREGGAPFCF